MSIVSGVINWNKNNENLINFNRPYNKELKRLKALITFGSISNFFAVKCSDEFREREHIEALKIDKEMN